MRKGLTLFVMVVAALGARRLQPSVAAQGGTAWFGTPGPAPLSDVRKPVMKYDDVFAPLPTHFPHRQGRFDELLDAAALKADQKKIVGFSLESLGAGDKVWGRRAATPAFQEKGAAGVINAIEGPGNPQYIDPRFACGKVRAADNIGMSWETSVTESAKAVGVTNQSTFLFDLWKQASRCYGVATYQSAGTTVSGDLGGYRPLEVPMTQMIQSGTFYHASGDVYEEVPAEGLERAARFHAFFIEQADRADETLIAAGKGTAYQSAIKGCQ